MKRAIDDILTVVAAITAFIAASMLAATTIITTPIVFAGAGVMFLSSFLLTLCLFVSQSLRDF